MSETETEKEPSLLKRREPFQFMLGLGLLGIVLMFVALVFTYSSFRARPDWQNFSLPKLFWLSSIVILLSSICLEIAQSALIKDKFARYRQYLGASLGLGILFVVLQILAWQYLQSENIFLSDSISGAFLYVISGLHLAHILGGLGFLAYLFWQSLRNRKYVDSFVYSVNPPNQLRLKLVVYYWHFVDVLWLALFFFFLYHHS